MRFVDDAITDELAFDINVIPLIDVLLVMLIFFMTSASFVASGGLDVKLPQAASQSSAEESKKLTVTVASSGEIQLDGRSVAAPALRELFREAAARPLKPVLVLRADEKVEHGTVVRILDEARSEGLEQIAIATVPLSK